MLSALTFWNTLSLRSAEGLYFYLKVCYPWQHFEILLSCLPNIILSDTISSMGAFTGSCVDYQGYKGKSDMIFLCNKLIIW